MKFEDIKVKYTDKDGKTYVADHRVWDKELFLKTRRENAAKEGGKIEVVK